MTQPQPTPAAQDVSAPDAAGEPVTHLVVMGVSGTGKTTIASLIRDITGRAFAEADDFHPEANRQKMAAGIPLNDEDRWPWLRSLAAWMTEEADAGAGAVLTCSALKRSYRDALREAHGRVVFAHLTGDADIIQDRMTHRPGHFMPASLLPSQLDTLEPLGPDEDGRTYPITGQPAEIAQRIIDDLLPPASLHTGHSMTEGHLS